MAGTRAALCVCVAALVVMVAEAALPPPERPYNILMLLPVSSKSHRNVFVPLVTALTERGHKVTMLSNHAAPDNNPNVVYIQSPLVHFNTDDMNAFEMMENLDKMFQLFQDRLPKIAREIYDVPEVKDLYNRRKEFDLVVIDSIFNEAMFPFTHNHTFITISPGGLDPSSSAVMGNLLNPAYVPNFLETYKQPFSTLDRWKNLVMSIVVPIMWQSSIEGSNQVEISKRFPDLPSLYELGRNMSLMFINSHYSITTPLPLLPNQVEVGGLHIAPSKPLPKDLENFLSGTSPVVYMSLGSVARSSAMPQHYKDIFFSVFSKLPYKVLWKFEENPQQELKNVFVQKWMPQQDILAHPNVKLFISHCGMLGSQEALYHGKPILGLPLFGDQPKNADAHEHNGLGKKILWSNLSEQLLMETIEELISNPKYQKKASDISRAMKDRPMSAVETAVFWTEYVIRHQGAVHLRSPERDMSWIQVLYLDLIFLVHLAIFLLYKIIQKGFSFLFKGKGSKSQCEKKKKRE
ncbi:UDP-glucuronosyl/UDP-glucosyltransferase [Trinorchestia longiramus]|nr:UDP-glucuronosyl/UDP-glucosyltransferase [Trinorchestia longiramus]